MNRNLLLAVLLLLATGCTESPTARQDSTTKRTPAPPNTAQSTTSLMVLPESVPLSEMEIRWQSGGGDGCSRPGGCTYYRITVRGDGRVTLEDLGWGSELPKAAPRQRSIPADDVVALINELLEARFLWAPPEGTRVAVRKGDSLFFLHGGVGGSGAWVDLTLRVGPSAKTVRLDKRTGDLRSVEDRIWKIGGPKAWPVR